MDPFTTEYLANLASDLTMRVLDAARRWLGPRIASIEKEQALTRCVQAGLVALLRTASEAVTKDEHHLLSDIFSKYFSNPLVGEEVGRLLRGIPLNVGEMTDLFEQAGFDAETLPGLDLPTGLAAFEAAFIAAAQQDESLLQGIIKTEPLLAKTDLQPELLEEMRELVKFLKQARPETVSIVAGQVIAVNLTAGERVVFQITPPELPPRADHWERHYLKTLIGQCDPLDLSPIDDTRAPGGQMGEAEPVRISDVFTALYLERPVRYEGYSLADAIQKPKEMERAVANRRKEAKPAPARVTEAVAAVPRLVILGQPGGGKSALVNFMVTQLARRRLGEADVADKLPDWPAGEKPLPVRIVLRRFAAWIPGSVRRGDAVLVWDYLKDRFRQMGCEGAYDGISRTLIDEGGIVFFDGLDEVSETDEAAKRTIIKEAIAEFSKPLDRCRVVVTCREYAYKQGDAWRLPESQFPVVELALFDLSAVESFTQTWYQVVGPVKGWGRDKCLLEASNLYQAIKELAHLQELAWYPLLLTLMAQVHGRDGTLPQDRADLYERAVNLLLTHWENRIVRDVSDERKVEPGLVMQLGVRAETLRNVLERVALNAHERQERAEDRTVQAADIPKLDLLEELETSLGSLSKAEKVVEYIQHRAGLLQARDNRTYVFPHRTFQEYLAATCILKKSNFYAFLRERVERDLAWWREVYLLAAGASRKTPLFISGLAQSLLRNDPVGTAVSPVQAEQARLAAQSLWETGFSALVEDEKKTLPDGQFAETYERAQRWLSTAMRADSTMKPAERAAAGDALARLGDPRPGAGLVPGTDLPDVEWCFVPRGPFWMGSKEESDEEPVRKVDIPYDYWMARYPVTVAQFRAFVESSGHKPKDMRSVRGMPNHPVVYVTWYDALAFCEWLTTRWRSVVETRHVASLPDGWEVRLPSEAEWEKAARGGLEIPSEPVVVRMGGDPHPFLPPEGGRVTNPNAQRRYPWGDKADPNRANYDDTKLQGTSAVGCFPGGASPYGCEEMSGNVWEWTRSIYRSYPYDPSDGREDLRGEENRVQRGGSFYNEEGLVRCAFRGWDYLNFHYDYGFRAAVLPI